MERLHVFVSGRVQGVWYRGSTARQATALGLVGWVRNLPDGRVELVAEGERGALEALAAWCGGGPPLARVTGVDVQWAAAGGGFQTFEVRR